MDLDLKLSQWQIDFLNSDKLILALSGASNSGKSWVCRLKILMRCLQEPNTHCFVTASTYTQTERAIIEPINEFLVDNNLSKVGRFNKGDGFYEFTNGSRIEVFSSDNMNLRLRSREFTIGFIEEASTIPEYQIEGLISEAIRRLRQKGHAPYHLLLSTNPGLKTSYLYNQIFNNPDAADVFARHITFDEGFNKNDEDYKSKLLRASKRDQDIFYHAKWGTLEDQAYILENNKQIQNLNLSDYDRFYISFDYGFSPDPFVYQLFSIKNSVSYLLDEIVLDSVPISRHPQFLRKWMSNYNVISYTGDNSAGSAEVRTMMWDQFNLSYKPTTKDRTLGWTLLADSLDTGRLIINSKCIRTIESLESLTWISGTRGIDTKGPLEDPADALRYFLMSYIFQAKEPTFRKIFDPQILSLSPSSKNLGIKPPLNGVINSNGYR